MVAGNQVLQRPCQELGALCIQAQGKCRLGMQCAGGRMGLLGTGHLALDVAVGVAADVALKAWPCLADVCQAPARRAKQGSAQMALNSAASAATFCKCSSSP